MANQPSPFDLCSRARAGLTYLNSNVDRKRGCLPYFSTMFKNDPAEARHDWPDFGDVTGRYVESFILARTMLGVSEPTEAEQQVRALLMSYFNEGDGLSYRPKPDAPYYSTILAEMYDAHVAEGFDQARVLWALLQWYTKKHGKREILACRQSIVNYELGGSKVNSKFMIESAAAAGTVNSIFTRPQRSCKDYRKLQQIQDRDFQAEKSAAGGGGGGRGWFHGGR